VPTVLAGELPDRVPVCLHNFMLVALEALQSLAERKRESASLEQVTCGLNKARGSTEKEFWNEQLGSYQYNEHNHDIMGDAMIGERYADVTGLPPVVNADRR
jgi:uncharacterized protein (DUF608 family)